MARRCGVTRWPREARASTICSRRLRARSVCTGTGYDIEIESRYRRGLEQEERRERGWSIHRPELIPPPQAYERLEGLPELIRRIVREELRPIHLLLEELGDRSGGPAGGGRA